MNWSEQNINLAQDRGNKLQQDEVLKAAGISDPDSLSPTERNRILGEINAAAEYKQLRDSGKTDAEIAAMSRDQREAALDRINGEVNPETLAIAALASVGTFFGGALAYMGLGGGASNGSTPPVRGQVVDVPARRREDGEDDNSHPADAPEMGADTSPIKNTPDAPEPVKPPFNRNEALNTLNNLTQTHMGDESQNLTIDRTRREAKIKDLTDSFTGLKADLNAKLKDSSLTTAEKNAIKKEIASLEKTKASLEA
ncbi:hypothetical protein, partial [Leptospira ilyithenensis]